MALNTFKSNHLMQLHFQGLITYKISNYNYNYNSHLVYSNIQDKIIQLCITESIELRQQCQRMMISNTIKHSTLARATTYYYFCYLGESSTSSASRCSAAYMAQLLSTWSIYISIHRCLTLHHGSRSLLFVPR